MIKVRPSTVRGKIAAPPSKSMTHRALICSALAAGETTIHFPLISDDTEATRRVLDLLNVNIYGDDDMWRVRGGDLQIPVSDLFCGGSGTTLRFTTALCSLIDGECRLSGGPTLLRRPVGPLLDGLRQLGVDCESTGGLPPVTIRGTGRITGGKVVIRGDISSQFISALLLITPLGDEATTLSLTTPLESKPYVSMTLEAQGRFGVEVQASDDMRVLRVERQSYRPAEVTVEGDWSSAAYLLAAGALAGEVTVENLSMRSLQADRAIVKILDSMGAGVLSSKGDIAVHKSPLTGIELDMSDSPDLFPVASTLCAAAGGRSVLRGLRRLRFKESDRVSTMMEGLRQMGIDVARVGDSVVLEGGMPRGCVVDPHKDHRIAMALAVLGLVADGETTIQDAGCVSKSYPGFWSDLETVGGGVRRVKDE
jgi:3-phosphoshikimate 1-carboxyvinyltransferase